MFSVAVFLTGRGFPNLSFIVTTVTVIVAHIDLLQVFTVCILYVNISVLNVTASGIFGREWPKNLLGYLGISSHWYNRSRNTCPVRCGTDFYGRGPLYVSPFVTVSSVECNVSDAVKFPDLDSFDSLTRSSYSRHDDNWMKLGRVCQHASALPSLSHQAPCSE